MKGHKLTRSIPVVVLTVSQRDSNIMKCGELGADNYLIKPLEFETFSRVTPKLGFHWTLVRPLAANNPG